MRLDATEGRSTAEKTIAAVISRKMIDAMIAMHVRDENRVELLALDGAQQRVEMGVDAEPGSMIATSPPAGEIGASVGERAGAGIWRDEAARQRRDAREGAGGRGEVGVENWRGAHLGDPGNFAPTRHHIACSRKELIGKSLPSRLVSM